jgi:hypothetical protein
MIVCNLQRNRAARHLSKRMLVVRMMMPRSVVVWTDYHCCCGRFHSYCAWFLEWMNTHVYEVFSKIGGLCGLDPERVCKCTKCMPALLPLRNEHKRCVNHPDGTFTDADANCPSFPLKTHYYYSHVQRGVVRVEVI